MGAGKLCSASRWLSWRWVVLNLQCRCTHQSYWSWRPHCLFSSAVSPACLFLYGEREIILRVVASSSLKRSGAEAEEWLCLLTQPLADSGTREPNSCFDYVIATYMALRKSPTVFASPLTFFSLKDSALRGRWSRKPLMSERKAKYKAAVPTADSVGHIPALTWLCQGTALSNMHLLGT